MAGRNQDGIKGFHITFTGDVRCDLGLGIALENGIGIGLDVLLDCLDDINRNFLAVRKIVLSAPDGIAEHHALVACTDALVRVDRILYLGRLGGNQADDPSDPVTETVADTSGYRLVIGMAGCVDFPGQHNGIVLGKAFAGHVGFGVFFQDFGKNRVGNLVRVFVRMVFAHHLC